MNLVDVKGFASVLIECVGQFIKGMARKPEIIGRDIQAGKNILVKLDMLENEGSLAYASCPENGNKPVVPSNAVMNVTHIGSIGCIQKHSEFLLQYLHGNMSFMLDFTANI